MHPSLSDRIIHMKASATIEMADKARQLTGRGIDVISLSIGEPDFDTPDHIKTAAIQAMQSGQTKYTPVSGLPVLKNAIVDKFKRDNQLNFSPENIVVSNGAKQSIANIMFSVLNPGDEIIIFTPYWVSYYEMAKLTGAIPVLVKADVEQDFKVTPAQLDKALTSKTKALLFSSPCNPTGSVFSEEEMRSLMQVIKHREDIVIISDEIYEYINFTDKHFSPATIDFIQNRTATVNGFSKGFAMTGWRLGYIGAPAWLAAACTKMQSQYTSGAAAFNQAAGAFALNSPKGPTKMMKKAYQKRCQLVLELINEIKGMKCNQPQGAFYAFPDISSFFGKSYKNYSITNADDITMYLLEEAHVALVSGSAFGDDKCVRISYATSEEILIEAIKRIGHYLELLS